MDSPIGKIQAACKVNGTTLARSAELGIADCTSSGPGVYLVTLADDYAIDAKNANHQVSALSSAGHIIGCVQLSDTAFGVTTFTHAGVPANCDFSFAVSRVSIG